MGWWHGGGASSMTADFACIAADLGEKALVFGGAYESSMAEEKPTASGMVAERRCGGAAARG
jgi:hypothetical protein